MKTEQEIEPFLFQPAASQRRAPEKSGIDLKGYRIVSLRLRTAEYLCFAGQVADSGMTNNQALRIAARRIAGFLEIDAETRVLLGDISRTLSGISQNLSKLNREAATLGTVDMSALAEQRLAFGQEYVRLQQKLGVIMNVSLRRQDGMAMLKVAQRT